MKLIYVIIVIVLMISAVSGQTMYACPPIDPNCHPSCVLYTAEHCRICRCANDLNEWSKPSYYSSGSSDRAVWDKGFSGDWSSNVDKDADLWRSTDAVHNTNIALGDDDNEEVVKYIVIEKGTDERYNTGSYSSRMDSMDIGGISPFHGPRIPASLLPGSASLTEHISANDIIHVPLVAPGQPQYCVRCKILNCPGTCERIDNNGCRSCPCAPSRYQTMPVSRYCSNKPDKETQPDCLTTKLCIESCKNGVRLGNIDENGCRPCSCIKSEPKHDGCPATLSCMLKCKDGYILGQKQLNGCPSCKCLSNGRIANNNNLSLNNNYKNNMSNQNNFNYDKFGNGGTDWTSGRHFEAGLASSKGNEIGQNGSGCKDSNYFLKSSNGIGSGKCEPPMCIDGHMSIDEAMQIGTASVGSAGGCNNGGKASYSGEMPFSSSIQASSGASSFSSGFSMNFGSSEKPNGLKDGITEAHTGSGRGMPSPFMSSMSGGVEKSNSFGYSPFAAAMSGGSSRENASAKTTNGHRTCPDLLHCLVTCESNYTLGDLDENGCQSCSCSN